MDPRDPSRFSAEGKELKSYSTFLAQYHRADGGGMGGGTDVAAALSAIELPGQYTGDRPPQPTSHVMLECVKHQLRVMPSLRMPKKVTVFGSDQREYSFLCKAGEDLRLDQRVQILFGAMNRCLAAHAQAAARELSLSTYHVMPLSEHVGLLEWVDGTQTLKALCTEMAPKGALKKAYDEFRAKNREGSVYLKKMTTKCVDEFAAVQAGVPTNLLARAVAAKCVSSEVFLSMRASFARSFGALTACGHVLGIGDRHLDNFLLDCASGRVVGIDFGHAFGSATYLLPVPELMGVRLTSQLTSFLKPLDTSVLLKGHMVLSLEALRAKRGDLMRLMEIFLSEPIVDWEAQTRKLSEEQRAKLEAEADESTAAVASTIGCSSGSLAPSLAPSQAVDAPMSQCRSAIASHGSSLSAASAAAGAIRTSTLTSLQQAQQTSGGLRSTAMGAPGRW